MIPPGPAPDPRLTVDPEPALLLGHSVPQEPLQRGGQEARSAVRVHVASRRVRVHVGAGRGGCVEVTSLECVRVRVRVRVRAVGRSGHRRGKSPVSVRLSGHLAALHSAKLAVS